MKDNFKIEGGSIVISINPKIYYLDVIYASAFVFIDKAYVILDGDPKKEVFVKLTPKEKYDLKKLGNEFYNELLNYAAYKVQSEKTKKIREMIVQRALFTNDTAAGEEQLSSAVNELEEQEDFDDPEGIAIPWEEKHGKKTKKKRSKN